MKLGISLGFIEFCIRGRIRNRGEGARFLGDKLLIFTSYSYFTTITLAQIKPNSLAKVSR